MKSTFTQRAIAVSLMAALGSAGVSPALAAEPATSKGGDSQAKIGLVEFVVAAGAVTLFQSFTGWAANRMNNPQPAQQPAPGQAPAQPTPAFAQLWTPFSSAAPQAGQPVQQVQQQPAYYYQTQAPQAVWVPAPAPAQGYPQQQYAPTATQPIYNSQAGVVQQNLPPMPQQQQMQPGQPMPVSPYYSTAPIVLGQPDLPMLGTAKFDPNQPWSSNYNYQGMQVAAVILNQANQPVEIRPLNAPFRTGERFKLRVISSFEGTGSIDAYKGIAPGSQGWVGQLYPARTDQVVSFKANEVVYLPLGNNEYFTFDGAAGVERMVINLRHPQAYGAQQNNQPIYRQDSPQGSNYLQMVAPGTFPAMSQTVLLQHSM